MKFYIITIFPDLFNSFLSTSLVKKAREKGIIDIKLINLRDFADPPHYKVDDAPYGGGAGMVLMAEPLARAVKEVKKEAPDAKVIYLTPKGKTLTQKIVKQKAQTDRNLILVCGRYEGIDQRFIDRYVDEEISIGDYILMGGELPAMVFIEAISRLLPGVLGNEESLEEESFQDGLKEYPHYTRPRIFEGIEVPKELLTGDHQLIKRWRKEMSKKITDENR